MIAPPSHVPSFSSSSAVQRQRIGSCTPPDESIFSNLVPSGYLPRGPDHDGQVKMDNYSERSLLMEQIQSLLGAIESVQACLETPHESMADGRFDAARAELRNASASALQVVERQRSAHSAAPEEQKKATLSSSLAIGAVAAERQAAKLLAAGDEAGAAKATENAAILRQMVAEHAVAERRQSFRLVHSAPATNRQE